ncbi:D-alanyl-D-alanine carboxypeptidase family protein [Malikia spinosa]|nr:serine hydrolase [Malikia spinosa]
MTHGKLQWLRRATAALSLGVTLSLMAPPSLMAAGASVKKKPVAAQKVKAQAKVKAVGKARVVSARAKRSAAKAVVQAKASPRPQSSKARRAAVIAAKSAAVAGGGLAAASAVSAVERKPDNRADAAAGADEPPKLSANAVFVMDQNSREVLVSKNDKAVMPIASLTKLMTGLLVADAKLPLDEEITITEDDLDIYKGTGSRLSVGTRLTRGEAMHLALMSSENRAAHALGRTYPGGMLNFVRLMNAKAAELGMRDTRYVEPTGLSVENRSSARDLALLVAAAYQRPLLREFSTSQGYAVESGRRVLQYHNSNRLTADPKWDIGLQKTGYISEAGRCMVMSAKLAGRQVIMVFLDAADKSARIGDAQRVRRYVESVVSADAIERLAWRKG